MKRLCPPHVARDRVTSRCCGRPRAALRLWTRLLELGEPLRGIGLGASINGHRSVEPFNRLVTSTSSKERIGVGVAETRNPVSATLRVQRLGLEQTDRRVVLLLITSCA